MLLFDQNLSFRLVKQLAGTFPGCLHVSRCGLSVPASDQEIWRFAKDHGLMVVTFDEDFSELLSLHGPPPKVIWLRMGNSPTKLIATCLLDRAAEIMRFKSDSDTHLLEVYR